MSLSSWKKKFYPIEAGALPLPDDDEQMILHALLKWSGALPDTCKRHKVAYQNHVIVDLKTKKEFNFIGCTCALCVKYYQGRCGGKNDADVCGNCPLKEVLGAPCDYESSSPWHESYCDPAPMIAALQQALKMVQSRA